MAVSFSILGLVETLSATGLVVELSPDGRWGSGVHTLAVSGPLQMVGAALLASGRKTRWVLKILGCYVFLVGVFGNLPLIFNPDVGGSAIVGLLGNLAVMGGIWYWLHSERIPNAHRVDPAPALPIMQRTPNRPGYGLLQPPQAIPDRVSTRRTGVALRSRSCMTGGNNCMNLR